MRALAYSSSAALIRPVLCFWAGVLLLASVISAQANTQADTVDGGALLKEVQKEEPAAPGLEQPAIEKPATDAPDGALTLEVERYEFAGNTLIGDPELEKLAAPYTNRELSLAQINRMLGEISDLYQDRGYLSRIYLPEQDIRDGVVRVEIVEARFGEVRFEGDTEASAIDPQRLERMLAVGQTSDEVLRLRSLERAALLANEYPSMQSRVVLSAGEQVGFTDIVVASEATRPYSATLIADNHGSESTGELRLTALGQIGNLLGQGERLQINGLLSDGNRYGAFNFEIPVGVHGLKVGLSASLLEYELTDGPAAILDAEGDARSADLNLAYPIIRNSKSRLDIRARLGRRDYTNDRLRIEFSDKSVDAFKLELRGRRADNLLGGGQFYYGLDFTFGDLELSGILIDPKTAGTYENYGWNIGRLQRLNDKTFVNFSLEGQFNTKDLDSSETFVLGGPDSVRAYPVLEASGDEGWLAKVELRRRLSDDFTLLGFYDHGRVSSHDTAARDGSLKGFGAGLEWRGPSGIFANLLAAAPVGDNPFEAETGTDDDLLGWFRIGKTF
ncbi:MAG: ShlB/FhaC/HecB family hemolysin secretion/activation protein [Opitutales bacterium]